MTREQGLYLLRAQAVKALLIFFGKNIDSSWSLAFAAAPTAR